MTQLSKHYTDIAKSMGFELEQTTSVGPLKFIRIRHVLSSNDITLEREAVEKMLDFLNICQLETTNRLLAERIEKLENAVFGQVSSRAETGNTVTDAETKLVELQVRARAIGTSIAQDGETGEYYYSRPRFAVPGASYRFYFTVGNALNPRRYRCDNGTCFIFDRNELSTLERWVEHDEELYAEMNKKYSVQR